jgi:hypothetical protein
MGRWFRELFDECRDYTRQTLYGDVVAPWINDARAAIQECRALLNEDCDTRTDEELQELSWNLYAFSRVLDQFVWHLQPEPQSGKPPETSPRSAVGLTGPEIEAFADAVGLTVTSKDEFHPFYHEPVHVEIGDPAQDQPTLVGCLWPCLMLDNMIIFRGGVRVSGGDAIFNKEQAETAPLFWSRYRRARLSMDQSIGWGSNSQWRTAFRRDFERDGSLLYNADGRFSLNETHHKDDQFRSDLPDAEWIHLVKYRYPAVKGHNPHDLYPWDYRYVETRT